MRYATTGGFSHAPVTVGRQEFARSVVKKKATLPVSMEKRLQLLEDVKAHCTG